MKNIKRCMAVALLALGLAPMQSMAAATTATMAVALTNVTSVATLSTSPITFGSVLPTDTFVWGNGTITANVSNGVTYKISLDAGLHRNDFVAGRSVLPCRVLVGTSGQRWHYELHQNIHKTMSWGDFDLANSCAGTIGVNPGGLSMSYTGTGADQVHNVYAYAKSNNGSSTSGLLSDSVTVTLTY